MRMHRKDNLEARLIACSDVLTYADLTEKNMKKAAELRDLLDYFKIFKSAGEVHLEVG